MEECSVQRARYLFVLQIFIMALKTNSIVETDEHTAAVPIKRLNLQKLLPQSFVEFTDLSNPIKTYCPLLPRNASEIFTKAASLLFTEQHLQLIFLYFPSLKGSNQKSLDAHSCKEFYLILYQMVGLKVFSKYQ